VHFTVVKPGQKAWNEIHKAFGNDVFLEDGQLNREALGKIIFADNNKRKILNKITHPKIQKMMFWAVIKYFCEGLYYFIIMDCFVIYNLSDNYFI
jgi:dephospho-CoA kinase